MSNVFYQEYWKEGKHHNPEWSASQFQELMGTVANRESVLDYGCGMGYAYQRQLSESVKRYIGADVSEMAVAQTRKKGLESLSIDPTNSKVDLPDCSVDGAVTIEVMEHLFDPLLAMRELHRVIKPDGRIVVTVPNYGYHAWRLLALLRAQVPSEPENPQQNRFNGVHIRYFSKLMLKRLLQDAGFVDVKIGPFDGGTVWDVFKAAGHFGRISQFARERFPSFMHLGFLARVYPNVFALRLHATARKP